MQGIKLSLTIDDTNVILEELGSSITSLSAHADRKDSAAGCRQLTRCVTSAFVALANDVATSRQPRDV